MHLAARAFIEAHARTCLGPVLEVGSRNINGGVRDLFPSDGYLGIDLVEGPGVDEVGDVADYVTDLEFATVVCCEVLEHYDDPTGLIAACHGLLEPGGVLLLTAAGPNRAPHSGVDGGEVRPGEFYCNVDPDDLDAWLTEAGFSVVDVDVLGDDVRARAVK